MRSGIIRQAIRRHRWSLLGPACTQALAACVISMMIMTAISLNHAQLTASERRAVIAADLADATTVFIGISIYLSILIVGVTMNLATSRQLLDIALLRVIGASPGQIRRSVALQAAIVAVPATIIGCLAAVPAGAVWVAALRAHDVLPQAVRFTPTAIVLPIALGIEVVTSVLGALLASGRTARIAPRVAVAESLTGRRRVSSMRIIVGLAEGRSNQAIATELHLALRSVEKHVTSIFTKLDLPPAATDHRRVLAVLRYLGAGSPGAET